MESIQNLASSIILVTNLLHSFIAGGEEGGGGGGVNGSQGFLPSSSAAAQPPLLYHQSSPDDNTRLQSVPSSHAPNPVGVHPGASLLGSYPQQPHFSSPPQDPAAAPRAPVLPSAETAPTRPHQWPSSSSSGPGGVGPRARPASLEEGLSAEALVEVLNQRTGSANGQGGLGERRVRRRKRGSDSSSECRISMEGIDQGRKEINLSLKHSWTFFA